MAMLPKVPIREDDVGVRRGDWGGTKANGKGEDPEREKGTTTTIRLSTTILARNWWRI